MDFFCVRAIKAFETFTDYLELEFIKDPSIDLKDI